MTDILNVIVSGWEQSLEASVTSASGVNGGRRIELDYPLSRITGIYDNSVGTGTNYWTEYKDSSPQARGRSIKHFEKYILLPTGTTLSAATNCWVTYNVWAGYIPLAGAFGSTGLVGLPEIWSYLGTNTFATEMTDKNTGIPERITLDPQAGGMVVKMAKVVTDGADIDMYVYNDPGVATSDTYATSNQDTDQNIGDDTNNAVGQSFVGNGGIIRTADLWLEAVLSPVGNATCKIYASTGADPNRTPTGSALATSDTVDVSAIGATYESVIFTFSTEYTLVDSTVYFVVLEYDGDATNYLHWGTDTSTPTHASNNFAVYTSSWAAAATTDGCFTVYTDGNPLDSAIIYQKETVNGINIDNSVWVIDASLTQVWVGYVDNGSATPASTTVELRGSALI